MTLQKLADGIFVDTSKIDKIKTLDAMIFDCDGVLIDITNSYDLAIKKNGRFYSKRDGEYRSIKYYNYANDRGFQSNWGF
jgi:FMN phosphatase YigB (HAD superfamily)